MTTSRLKISGRTRPALIGCRGEARPRPLISGVKRHKLCERSGGKFIHEASRSGTKGALAFVCFLREVWCGFVDEFLRPTPAARGDWRTWVPLLCLALVVIQLAWGIINWITNYLFVKIGLEALLRLRTDLYSYLQRLSLKFHDARRSTDSSFRVAYDSQSIQTIYNKGFTNIFASVIALIGTFIVMLRLDWVFAVNRLRFRNTKALFSRKRRRDSVRFEWCTPSDAKTSRSGNFISRRNRVCRQTCG